MRVAGGTVSALGGTGTGFGSFSVPSRGAVHGDDGPPMASTWFSMMVISVAATGSVPSQRIRASDASMRPEVTSARAIPVIVAVQLKFVVEPGTSYRGTTRRSRRPLVRNRSPVVMRRDSSCAAGICAASSSPCPFMRWAVPFRRTVAVPVAGSVISGRPVTTLAVWVWSSLIRIGSLTSVVASS